MAKSKTPAQRLDEIAPFLRTIAEYPDDDTSRLVFADWLDEHDQPDRAKFIRLQIELARLDPTADGYAEKTAAMRRCGMFTEPGELPFFDHLPTEKCRIGFRRGFIEAIDTNFAETLDTSGIALVPLLGLRVQDRHIAHFKRFPKLKWFEYFNGYGRNGAPTPAQLLEVLGPNGWFEELEELSLPQLTSAHFEAGVIPRFDLPRLRNFYLETGEFSNLGVTVAREEPEDDYGRGHPWGGLPDYLPRNALPNPKTPLEQFVWHGSDDSDLFDDGWEWRGPTMESLLTQLRNYPLKRVEMATDYDDHEGGTEGIIAARYQQNPLELSATLDHITLDDGDLRLLDGSKRKLKGLRVHCYNEFDANLFRLLGTPVCSQVESLQVTNRGWWEGGRTGGPSLVFPKLGSLKLSGLPFGLFSRCQFPNLISLSVVCEPRELLTRKWPKLQHLHLEVHQETKLRDWTAFAKSDGFPNLTTLTVDTSFFRRDEADLSFFARCPHMPHLSLIRFPSYSADLNYVVADGELIPVRGDVMLDGLKPLTPFHFRAAF